MNRSLRDVDEKERKAVVEYSIAHTNVAAGKKYRLSVNAVAVLRKQANVSYPDRLSDYKAAYIEHMATGESKLNLAQRYKIGVSSFYAFCKNGGKHPKRKFDNKNPKTNPMLTLWV